jgi:hypothetical protein
VRTVTDNVVPLHACRCGKPAKLYVVLQPGSPPDDPLAGSLDIRICPTCVERTQRLFEQVRPVFRTMMDVNIPQDVAEQVMGYLLDLLDPDKGTRYMHPPAS